MRTPIQILFIFALLFLSFCNAKEAKKLVKASLKKPPALEVDEPSFNPETGQFIADRHTLGLWHFEEGKEEFVFDSGKYEHDGIVANPKWSNGVFGKALNVSKASSVEVDDAKLNLSPTHSLTVEGWFFIKEIQTTSYPGLLGKITKNAGDGSPSYTLWMVNYQHDLFPSPNLIFGLTPTTTNRTEQLDSTVNWRSLAGKWHYIAGTYNGEYMKVYVDGKLQGSKKLQKGTTISISKYPLTIGKAFFYRAEALIDELRISQVARSDKAISLYWDGASKFIKK